MSAPRVAVVLVTWNSQADLPACLASVVAQDYGALEIVAVDCGSRDRSLDVLRRADLGSLPRKIEALGRNLGFAGGMNAALALTDAPLVLALNADARPSVDAVSRMVARLESGREIAAVTPRLVRPGLMLPESAADRRLLDACGMYLTSTWRHLDRGSGEVDDGRYGAAEEVFGATGAAVLYRRQALDDVAFADGDIFDSLFHSYREDAELCFRFQERGWRVIYEPAAVVEHRRAVVPTERRRVSAEINRQSLKNRYLLRAYHQTPANALRTAVPTLARDLGAFLYVLLRERSSFSAYAWLWRHRRQILQRRRHVQGRKKQPSADLDRWFYERSRPLASGDHRT